MKKLTKVVLKYLGNKHTHVESKDEFKGNYYSNLTDTIYVATKFHNKELPKGMKNVSKNAAEFIVVCHECIHSMQSKVLHTINTIFSNLSLILIIACLVFKIFNNVFLWLKILTITSLGVNIFVRVLLENDAITRSIDIAKELVEKNVVNELNNQEMVICEDYIEKHKCLAIAQMIIGKVIAVIIICII